jgi:hypothetical protein
MKIKRDKSKELYRYEVRKKYGLTNYQIRLACDLNLIGIYWYIGRKSYAYNITFDVQDIEKNLTEIRTIPKEESEVFEESIRKRLVTCASRRSLHAMGLLKEKP